MTVPTSSDDVQTDAAANTTPKADSCTRAGRVRERARVHGPWERGAAGQGRAAVACTFLTHSDSEPDLSTCRPPARNARTSHNARDQRVGSRVGTQCVCVSV